MKKIPLEQLENDFRRLGVSYGDLIYVRATLGAIGPFESGRMGLIKLLLKIIGPEGTLVSLSSTSSSFLSKPKLSDAFDHKKKSNAGAFPNAMLEFDGAYRSQHPMCSFVAIGKHAQMIVQNHNEYSRAYEPMRKIIELRGKMILIGCVYESPGFTTAHLAESDLGYLDSLPVFPWLRKTYYRSSAGDLKLYRRKDPGLCSNSYFKFYPHYENENIMSKGYIGSAYSILVPALEAYLIELNLLRKNRKFNVCDSADCWTCNAGRWDLIYRAPFFILKKLQNKLLRVVGKLRCNKK